MGQSRKPNVAKKLVENSVSAMFSAIEIHNKPIFSYRYETSIILFINARELLLKWYIYKYHNKVKLQQKDKDWNIRPKPFLECLSFVKGQLGKQYFHWFANIEKIYEYRCSYTHFYWEDLDSLMFLMISESIKFYTKFVEKFFPKSKIHNEDFLILPIWFKPIMTVVDILSTLSNAKDTSKEVKEFINSIIKVSIDLYEDWNNSWIFSEYGIKLYNEKSSNNAEITAKRSSKEWIEMNNTKKIQIIDKQNSKEIDFENVRLWTIKEQKEYQNKYCPLTNRELKAKIKEKYQYKYRNWINDEIKKYKQNIEYAFACSWELQIKYSPKLIDIIWSKFLDNPNLQHLNPNLKSWKTSTSLSPTP